MKSIATRIASILATALIAATTLFTTHVTAQESVSVFVPEIKVLEIIKKDFKFLHQDGRKFVINFYNEAERTISVRVEGVADGLTAQLVTVDSMPGKVCYRPVEKKYDEVCLELSGINSGDKIILHKTEQLWNKKKSTSEAKLL